MSKRLSLNLNLNRLSRGPDGKPAPMIPLASLTAEISTANQATMAAESIRAIADMIEGELGVVTAEPLEAALVGEGGPRL